MKKKIRFTHSKERVVISDVLPYEIPLTFSNRYFYSFLVENSVQYSGGEFTWIPVSKAADQAVKILLGLKLDSFGSLEYIGDKVICHNGDAVTIPFTYGITHKEDELRVLSFAHPKNQIKAVEFYERYKDLIVYYCQRSKFTLRAPVSVARCVYWDKKSKLPEVDMDNNEVIEEEGGEYASIKSYFVYKKISNIFKFFESKDYHRCEKIYNNMAKLDISKCFDSIYTHSIAWSILGKATVKDIMSGVIPGGGINGSFSDAFDRLLQQENYSETNGILIGPETSRIFAEIILQSVDKEVYEELEEQGVIHGDGYEIFRYVDDYFVFYNDPDIYKKILAQIQFSLKHYKLNLNTEKEVVYHKPIITEITIAKKLISNLLNDKLKYKIETFEEECGDEVYVKRKGSIYVSAASLITEFKTIIKSSEVEYRDVLNYSLSIVESKCKKILEDFRGVDRNSASAKSLVYAIASIVEFSFFIYSVSPRVNTTVKLSRILFVLVSFLRTKEVSKDDMDGVFKKIFENIYFIANKNKSKKYAQVETLYLLIILSELGKDYRIEEEVLASYFAIKKNEDGGYVFSNELNLFSITVLLFYIKDKKRYSLLRSSIEEHIRMKMFKKTSVICKDAERTVLLFDSISCPYLSMGLKRDILVIYGVSDPREQEEIIALKKEWFTKWIDFDWGKELDAKRSLEVY